MINNWLDKYKPLKTSDIIGHQDYIRLLTNYLNQYSSFDIDVKKIAYPCILINGKNGIGKTLMVDLLLKEKGFERAVISLDNVVINKTKKKNKDTISKASGGNRSINVLYASIKSSKTVEVVSKPKKRNDSGFYISSAFDDETVITQYVKSKVALVFDDISSISNAKEKDAIKSLVKQNNKLKQFPIIIISNSKYNKLANDIRKMVTYNMINQKAKEKYVNEIRMNPPQFSNIEKFIEKICQNERLRICKNDYDEILEGIIQYSQYDMRKIIYCLEEIKMMHENSLITLELYEQYKFVSKMKDIDPSIYEATEMLLNKYAGIDKSIILYSEDRATIPLIVHENFPLNIKLNYPFLSPLEQIKMICNISKNISESDKVDGLIYSNQSWNLQAVHGFYSCVMPSFHINSVPNKLAIKELDLYKYTKDYTKTSTRKINNKAIKKIKEKIHFKKMIITDFLHMAHIIKQLINQNKLTVVCEILKPYEITVKELESIINIDRISPKIVLTSKTKTILKNKLSDD